MHVPKHNPLTALPSFATCFLFLIGLFPEVVLPSGDMYVIKLTVNIPETKTVLSAIVFHCNT